MARVIDAKFDSDDGLRRKLLATGDAEIVEARRDRRWGIGLMPAKACSEGRSKWGQNWLGLQLMRTRKRLAEKASTGTGDEADDEDDKIEE